MDVVNAPVGDLEREDAGQLAVAKRQGPGWPLTG
jgi:hypothetical protein